MGMCKYKLHRKTFNQASTRGLEFWNDLFEYANQNNVTCVLAAGNNNILTGFDPFQRSKNTIKVGAIDQNFNKAKFSNFGDKTTIYAPGVGIFGAKPNNSYEFLNGTSMAAPIVSGFIGLFKSQNKNLTNQEIINLLKANSVMINDLNILKCKTSNSLMSSIRYTSIWKTFVKPLKLMSYELIIEKVGL